ncbi:MAG: hypothetical protein QMD00_06150 [Hadesarchaea archaeon]|nr:hypothetical protein [Hadesarchaea archaeon]
MEEKPLVRKRRVKALGTARGRGTSYSCLYSCLHSTVKDRARGYALLKRRKRPKVR